MQVWSYEPYVAKNCRSWSRNKVYHLETYPVYMYHMQHDIKITYIHVIASCITVLTLQKQHYMHPSCNPWPKHIFNLYKICFLNSEVGKSKKNLMRRTKYWNYNKNKRNKKNATWRSKKHTSCTYGCNFVRKMQPHSASLSHSAFSNLQVKASRYRTKDKYFVS